MAEPTRAPAPLPVPQGKDRICAYCHGTGRIPLARACTCQQPNGSCAPGSCEDGWVYLFEFCDWCKQ